MFDWFSLNDAPIAAVSEPDAIDMVRNDHDSLKELFDRFKKAKDRRSKTKIAREAIAELNINAVLEEEIFYPAVRQHIGKDIMNEADEEHHVAHVLIAELEEMDGRGDHFDAKFNVLAENVRHHIKAEESRAAAKGAELGVSIWANSAGGCSTARNYCWPRNQGLNFTTCAGSSRQKLSQPLILFRLPFGTPSAYSAA